MELRVRMLNNGVYPDERTYSTLLRGALRACNVEQCALLVNAALDQNGARARSLLEEDLVRSVLILTQRHNEWDTCGRELQERLRASGISVRLPLPPDACNRNDGYGQSRREDNNIKRHNDREAFNRNDGYGQRDNNVKRTFGNSNRDQVGKEGKYYQHQYNQHRQQEHYQQQQRRY